MSRGRPIIHPRLGVSLLGLYDQRAVVYVRPDDPYATDFTIVARSDHPCRIAHEVITTRGQDDVERFVRQDRLAWPATHSIPVDRDCQVEVAGVRYLVVTDSVMPLQAGGDIAYVAKIIPVKEVI